MGSLHVLCDECGRHALGPEVAANGGQTASGNASGRRWLAIDAGGVTPVEDATFLAQNPQRGFDGIDICMRIGDVVRIIVKQSEDILRHDAPNRGEPSGQRTFAIDLVPNHGAGQQIIPHAAKCVVMMEG